MSDQVALVSEAAATLGTLVGFLLGGWRHVGRVVVQVLVTFQQLLLAESIVTLERFLVGVNRHVGLQVEFGDGGVGIEVALEVLFSLVSFLVSL